MNVWVGITASVACLFMALDLVICLQIFLGFPRDAAREGCPRAWAGPGTKFRKRAGQRAPPGVKVKKNLTAIAV